MDQYSFSLFSINFWLGLVWFLIACFFSIVLPGYCLTSSFKHLSFPGKIIAAIAVGLALFGLQGYVFGYMQMRWLSILYLLFFSFWTTLIITRKHITFTSVYKKFRLQNYIGIIFFIILGSIVQLIPVFFSGLQTPQGISFYQINAHDGVFHLGVIQSLVKHVPPLEPGLEGVELTNYHYWSDLVMAEIVRLWGAPIIHVYFQYFPLILAPLLGISVYTVLSQWTRSRTIILWGLFFLYFSGDFNYFFMFLFHRVLNISTISIDNGAIQFINMPQAFAKFLFFVGLLLFDSWHKTKKTLYGLCMALVFSTLFGFKVYFGLVAAGGLSLYVAAQYMYTFFHSQRKTLLQKFVSTVQENKMVLLCFLTFLIISAGIFLPTNKNSGGLFWAPFSWPKLLLNLDKLNWNEWWLRLQVYQESGSQKHLIVWYGIATTIFLVAIYSVRLLGFITTPSLVKKMGWHNAVFIFPMIWFTTFIGINTLQVSGGYNVFNFFIVALTLSTFTTAIFLDYVLHIFPKIVAVILAIFIILLTIPRVIHTDVVFLYSWLYHSDVTTIRSKELEMVSFIKKETPSDAIIQAHPGNNWERETPYLSFFTNRYTYLGGDKILESHNQKFETRQQSLKELLVTQDPEIFSTLLDSTGIDYFIMEKSPTAGQHLPFKVRKSHFNIIYENKEFIVLQNKPLLQRFSLKVSLPEDAMCEER